MSGLRFGWDIFWDENHPPSKFCGNPQIRPADKPTEKSSRDQRKVDKSDVQISLFSATDTDIVLQFIV